MIRNSDFNTNWNNSHKLRNCDQKFSRNDLTKYISSKNMLDDLEKRSLQENRWLQYPIVPFIFIFGKLYACQKCDIDDMNRGSCHQHVKGKAHKIGFYTGLPIKKPIPPSLNQQVSQVQKPAKLPEKVIIPDSNALFAKIIERRKNDEIDSWEPPEPNIVRCLIRGKVIKERKIRERRWYDDLEPEQRKMFINWQKIQKLKQVGMPQHVIDEYMIKFGFKEPEPEKIKTSPQILREVKNLINETDDPIVKLALISAIS